MRMLVRKAEERGHANHGWLDTWHTFSFADYVDPRHMGFRALRVVNDDRVQAGQGFSSHPHRDMEILTYVLEGALAHQDSMGNGSVIRPGDVQRMSAGTGVLHSEFNASKTEPVHLLQIWLLPAERGLPPSYEQRAFPAAERRGRLRRIASPNGAEGSVVVHSDATVFATLLERGERVEHALREDRHAWVHVARGRVRLGDRELQAGDGVAIPAQSAPTLQLEGVDSGELLLFDLG